MANSYNPILETQEVSRWKWFLSRPTPQPGVALVLFCEGQPPVTLQTGHHLTAGEVLWGGHKTFYKVDIAEHTFTFECKLPCQSDAFDFQTEAQVTYSVNDPIKIVERQVTDAQNVLEPLITDTMRSESRRYDVEESAEAERAIRKAVESENYDVGFKINRLIVKLNLEEEARVYIRQLREIKRNEVLTRRQAGLMRTKMDSYAPLVQAGDWQMLAVQLANNPQDVSVVMNAFNQLKQAERAERLRTLKLLLEEDALEGFQLEEVGQRVLQRLVEDFGTDEENRALGSPQEPKLLSAE